jgi:hypothetical protein
MGKLRIVWALAIVAALTLALAGTAVAGSSKTEFRANLAGSATYRAANGKAVYKVDGGEREFQVEVEDARTLAGKTVNVYVNGAKVGSMRINSFGDRRLSRNSDLGQAVPTLSSGSSVMVKTTTGVLVVSGTAQRTR